MPLNEGATSQILPFCPEGTEGSGDLMTIAEYTTSTLRLRGHQQGMARRELQNRAMRQVSLIAAGLAQYMANRYAAGVIDNGNVDAIEAAMIAAVERQIGDLIGEASTTTKGIVELATPTETKTGTATSLAVTPKGLADTLGDLTSAPQFDATKRAATTEFVQRALGSLAGAAAFGANTVLDITAVGKIIGPTTGGLTFTLPPSADAPPGALIRFNGNGFGMTIARSGADMIVTPPNSVTAFALGALDSAVFRRSTGGGAWILDEGSVFLKYTTAFGALLGASGYQRLPSGLIIQWVQVTSNVTGPKSFSWPIAFPSAVLGAVATHYWGANVATTAITPAIASVTLSGATINETDASSGHNFSIFAIGV